MMRIRLTLVLGAMISVGACSSCSMGCGVGGGASSGLEIPGVVSTAAFEPAFPALRFTRPVALASARDGSNRLFVLEQAGRVLVFANQNDSVSAEVFLDLRSLVLSPESGGGTEEGLLGIAFDPQFSSSRIFYVVHSMANPRRNVLARYRVSAHPNQADVASRQVVLEIDKPFSNHNGGQLAFGKDGMLYLSVGDGGSQGDPFGNAQNTISLLGKILRINPNAPTYVIPPDNPFVGTGARAEVWALGFRNPWRFSFDRLTQELWVGDGGENTFEEINLVARGENFGWNVFEGTQPFRNPRGFPAKQFKAPLLEYPNTAQGGRAVIGGFVYRGLKFAALQGVYFYGDFVSGRVWGLTKRQNTVVSNLEVAQIFNLSAFGEDEVGELYALSYVSGSIFRLAERAP